MHKNYIHNFYQHLHTAVWGCCFAFIATSILSSCENAIIGAENGEEETTNGYAHISINSSVASDNYETSTRTDDEESVYLNNKLCSRFDIAIYKNGERIAKSAQKSSDSDFGTYTADLEIGTEYEIVAIAHSCSSAMTTTDIEKITADREVTDIFWAYQTFTPTKDASLTMTLHRIVAMVRFCIDEATPSNAKSMYFYYTGGSSTFNGKTGLGSVNSKQNIQINVPSTAYDSTSSYEIYTIPKSAKSSISLTVKAFNSSEEIIKSAEFSSVAIEQNCITEYRGKFFSEDPNTDPDPGTQDASTSSQFKIVTAWNGTHSYSY